jgi:ribosomal protein S18 acetylase RimI-like enzyme
MPYFHFRVGTLDDVPHMARIRSREWESEAYWTTRIAGYMKGDQHPQHALQPRVIYVALTEELMAGFIAGHQTRRLGCTGELEWINVIPEYRRMGVASELLHRLVAWFVGQSATKVCVDVAEDNLGALAFYKGYGAVHLNPHWLYWEDIRFLNEGWTCI